MRRLIFVPTCLLLVCHGRRLQIVVDQPAESQRFEGRDHRLKELTRLLFAYQPSFTRAPASQQRHSVVRAPPAALKVDPFDVPRPDPSILISAKPDNEQQLWFAGINAGLLFGTAVLVSILTGIENILPLGWAGTLGNLGSVPLGLIFVAVGIAHFAKKEAFLGIVPPIGTWGGLWQVPAPGAKELGLTYAEYHTYWTGIAEIGGGLLLALAGVGILPMGVQQFDAFLMFLLTIAVTPANIYMATHDAQMSKEIPPLKYPDSHLIRGALQIILLAEFWKLAFH